MTIPRTALTAAVILLAATAAWADDERCYGVARAGQNDGIDNREAPGTSMVDYQGNAWIAVPAGSCLTMALPAQADGTPRRGSLDPLERDAP